MQICVYGHILISSGARMLLCYATKIDENANFGICYFTHLLPRIPRNPSCHFH